MIVFMNLTAIIANIYINKYQKVGYPPCDIVLMGSSSIQNWGTSQADVGPLHSVNVGISGTVTENWFGLVDELVVPFNPRMVIVYLGANDINNSGKSSEAVSADLERLFGQIHAGLPSADIYFISIFPTIQRPDTRADMQAVNALTLQRITQENYLHYIDCAAALQGADGEPLADVFMADNVHLNEKGYAIWADTIRRSLLADR
jgi:lysophospholipase L1-like esterase